MEEKTKFVNPIKTPFTWVENDLIRSKNLSFEVKGLYLTLRSFGENVYPSIDYLCSLGNVGKSKLYRILKELIEKKLILRKRIRGNKGYLERIEYILLPFKEFLSEQCLEIPTSHPRVENPYVDYPRVDNRKRRRIIKKEKSLSKKKTHTEMTVCEDEVKKIKKTKTFQNSDSKLIEKIIKKNGKEAVLAAEYIEKSFSGQTIKNPLGLLIRTLERGTYSELPPEKTNNLNSEIGKLNAEYKGFTIFRNEKIKEFLNIGGRIAFNTDNCLREIIYTPAKSCEEFKSYLQKINSS